MIKRVFYQAMMDYGEIMQDIRAQAMQEWLAGQDAWREGQLTPLMGDASFRRYFQIGRASCRERV